MIYLLLMVVDERERERERWCTLWSWNWNAFSILRHIRDWSICLVSLMRSFSSKPRPNHASHLMVTVTSFVKFDTQSHVHEGHARSNSIFQPATSFVISSDVSIINKRKSANLKFPSFWRYFPYFGIFIFPKIISPCTFISQGSPRIHVDRSILNLLRASYSAFMKFQ